MTQPTDTMSTNLYKSSTTGEVVGVRNNGDGTYNASEWLHHAEVEQLLNNSHLLASLDCSLEWTDADFSGMIALEGR